MLTLAACGGEVGAGASGPPANLVIECSIPGLEELASLFHEIRRGGTSVVAWAIRGE